MQRDGCKIGLNYPPIFAVESLTLARRDKNYFWRRRFGEYWRKENERQQSEQGMVHSATPLGGCPIERKIFSNVSIRSGFSFHSRMRRYVANIIDESYTLYA
jgi:hypothetical protein